MPTKKQNNCAFFQPHPSITKTNQLQPSSNHTQFCRSFFCLACFILSMFCVAVRFESCNWAKLADARNHTPFLSIFFCVACSMSFFCVAVRFESGNWVKLADARDPTAFFPACRPEKKTGSPRLRFFWPLPGRRRRPKP